MGSRGEQQSCLEVEYGSLKFFSCMFMNQHQQRKVETAVCTTGPRELGFLQNFKRWFWKYQQIYILDLQKILQTVSKLSSWDIILFAQMFNLCKFIILLLRIGGGHTHHFTFTTENKKIPQCKGSTLKQACRPKRPKYS